MSAASALLLGSSTHFRLRLSGGSAAAGSPSNVMSSGIVLAKVISGSSIIPPDTSVSESCQITDSEREGRERGGGGRGGGREEGGSMLGGR